MNSNMRGKWSVVAVLFTIIFSGAVNSESCDQDELMKCSIPLPGLSSSGDLSETLNREQLDNSCQNLQASMRCIHDYTETCMQPNDRHKFRSMYSGVNNMMQKLCQPGSYQEDYLRFTNCIRSVKPKYEQCSKAYEVTLARLNKGEHGEGEGQSEYLRTLCCSFQEYLSCSERTVQLTCGDSEAAFTGDFLKSISSDIIKSYCLEYRGAECSMNAGARQHYNWTLLSLILPLFLLTNLLPF